jgi:DNA-binding HxlR family transcriptional regulator
VTERIVLDAADEVAPENACPIAPIVDIVFSRWTTPILWTLHHHGPHRFVELEQRIVTITPKVLTERLRRLERDGLVERTYHAEVPPRVVYAITDLGRSLAPVFASLGEWSVNLPRVELSRHAYDAAQTMGRRR